MKEEGRQVETGAVHEADAKEDCQIHLMQVQVVASRITDLESLNAFAVLMLDR